MTFRATALALCAAALGFGQTDWRFAQPDADLRMSLNVQAVLKSDPVNAALKKAEEGTTKEQTAQIQMVMGILSSIDRIAISARQKAGAAKPAAGATSAASLASDSDALVWVTGSFDPKIVLGLFPSTGTSKVQQVGPHSILIGEGDSFAKALARISGQAAAGPADELADNDLWIAGDTAMMTPQAGSPSSSPISLQDLKKFSLGVNFKASPEVNLNLIAADDAGAGRMMGQMQVLMALAGTAPQAASLKQMLQFKQEGPSVKLHMVIPPEVLQMAQTMAQQNLSGGGAGAGASSPMQGLAPLLGLLGMGGGAKSQPAPAPKPSGDIVIYGLDDGPRVIKTN